MSVEPDPKTIDEQKAEARAKAEAKSPCQECDCEAFENLDVDWMHCDNCGHNYKNH